jgi:hypothetical protein
VAARHVARLSGWILACALTPIALSSIGRSWIALGAGLAIAGTLWLLLWLPRAAHAAFNAGRHARAARRYGVIAGLAFTSRRERAAALSRAGCAVAAGRFTAADHALAAFET